MKKNTFKNRFPKSTHRKRMQSRKAKISYKTRPFAKTAKILAAQDIAEKFQLLNNAFHIPEIDLDAFWELQQKEPITLIH